MGDDVTTRKIIELLKHRHQPPEWAHFVELNEGTGRFGHGWIDFFAFNLWPSKRYLKVAYEIKVSRSDFARELNNPKKREKAERFADECYFAMPCGLVKPDEIPEGWGLIEMIASGLRVKKRAMQRKVEALPMSFVASVARRSTDDGPSLPLAVWLLAGQEVDAERLQELASEAVRSDVAGQILDARAEEQRAAREKYQDAVDMARVIRKHLGWGMDAAKLDTWFDDQQLTLNRNTIALLTRTRNEIDRILVAEDGRL